MFCLVVVIFLTWLTVHHSEGLHSVVLTVPVVSIQGPYVRELLDILENGINVKDAEIKRVL